VIGSTIKTCPRSGKPASAVQTGFTMIELIVVMAVLGLLLSLAVPRFLNSLERGKEDIVAHDLAQLRKALDQYYGDKGAYPDHLEDLVSQRYLRNLPVNPFTGDIDWIVVPPPFGQKGGVYDVRAPIRDGEPTFAPAPATEPDTPAEAASAAQQ
jgi:general secretion pathway protein G